MTSVKSAGNKQLSLLSLNRNNYANAEQFLLTLQFANNSSIASSLFILWKL